MRRFLLYGLRQANKLLGARPAKLFQNSLADHFRVTVGLDGGGGAGDEFTIISHSR